LHIPYYHVIDTLALYQMSCGLFGLLHIVWDPAFGQDPKECQTLQFNAQVKHSWRCLVVLSVRDVDAYQHVPESTPLMWDPLLAWQLLKR
jgi:hypothetical protein